MDKVCNWVKYFLLIGMSFISYASFAQSFAEFFADFVRHPDIQYKYVRFPLPTEKGVVKSKSAYLPLRLQSKTSLPMVYVDSLGMATRGSEVTVFVVSMMKNSSVSYTFVRRNGWQLISQQKGAENGCDVDFVSFLKEYSKDETFQKKRTIFPFPYRSSGKNRNKAETNLLMPREWEQFDFIALYPSLCLICPAESLSANNRRLVVMKGGRLATLFNFIKINKKWYLIEIEDYS